MNIYPLQAFKFMVGPGHCPMNSKYGPSLSKAVGPVDPSFLVVKKSHFNKNIHLTSTKQKVYVGSQYSKTCHKQPLKKDKTKILITNGSLMKVESIAELVFFFEWPLQTGFTVYSAVNIQVCIQVSVSVCR